jgi:hypothetical protein
MLELDDAFDCAIDIVEARVKEAIEGEITKSMAALETAAAPVDAICSRLNPTVAVSPEEASILSHAILDIDALDGTIMTEFPMRATFASARALFTVIEQHILVTLMGTVFDASFIGTIVAIISRSCDTALAAMLRVWKMEQEMEEEAVGDGETGGMSEDQGQGH